MQDFCKVRQIANAKIRIHCDTKETFICNR